MRSKHIFVETCQLTLILFHFTHTTTVSQNVANYRSLSYRPDQVALELREMQKAYSAPRYQSNYRLYTNAFTNAEGDEGPMNEVKLRGGYTNNIRYTGEREETEVETDVDAKKRYEIKDVVIDFDELVNKVKDKIKDELVEKKGKNIYKSNVDQENDDEEPREAWKHFMTSKSPKNAGVTPDYKPPYKRVPMKKSKKQPQTNDEIFEVADLTKVNDSYEDYITPKRGKIYASDTDSEIETLNPLQKNKGEPKESCKKNEDQPLKYKNLPKAADILKGRSSDKLRKIKKLDDPINFVNEEYDPNETDKPVDHSEKAMFVKLGDDSDKEPAKLKGTMIPTRQFFKMSSSNYFAKLPAVAEKYDFNEPLPDKDREPEKMKYFSNPPARINKKVRLQNSDVEQDNK